MICLGELEPVDSDVLVQSRYPGHDARPQLPQRDGSSQVGFYIGKPFRRFLVNFFYKQMFSFRDDSFKIKKGEYLSREVVCYKLFLSEVQIQASEIAVFFVLPVV